MQFHGDLSKHSLEEKEFCVSVAAKNTMNSLMSTRQKPRLQRKSNLKKGLKKLQHQRICEAVADIRRQFGAAGMGGWAQVCSLAWVNKEKTGAIRRTCQA